jgi:hypothetical protein
VVVLPVLFCRGSCSSSRFCSGWRARSRSYLEKPSPRATAQVILRPVRLVGPVIGGAPPPDHAARYLRVMSALARSPSLANRVVRAANVPGLTAAGLLAKTRVTAEGDGNVLEFTVTNASLATARRLAYTYASEYAKAQNERAVRRISDAAKQLRATIASLPRKSATRASLIREAKGLSVIARLADKGTSVLGQASATPVRKHVLRNGFIGGLLGVLLGVALLLGLCGCFPLSGHS